MGWPKGKPRGIWAQVPPRSSSNKRIQNPFAAAVLSRVEALRAHWAAVAEFVESGEHIEAERNHPGIKAQAEAAYAALRHQRGALVLGADRARRKATLEVEARRRWIALHCKEHVFDKSRKRGIAAIQAMMKQAGYAAPSEKRLYADIAAIRKNWVTYLSHAIEAE